MDEHFAEEQARQDEADENARLEGLKVTEGLKAVLDDPRSRRWLIAMLRSTHIFELSITPGIEPSLGVASFREGERYIGLIIWNEIRSDFPEHVPEILKELYSHASGRRRDSDS